MGTDELLNQDLEGIKSAAKDVHNNPDHSGLEKASDYMSADKNVLLSNVYIKQTDPM